MDIPKPTDIYRKCIKVIESLDRFRIQSIVYGSIGLSLYLGNYKKNFPDLDLLIERDWLGGKWRQFMKIMAQIGFELIDEHEHEFKNSDDFRVAFSGKDILVRNNICDPNRDLVIKTMAGYNVKTLSLNAFLKAYEYSCKDGYRQSKRILKDKKVNELIKYRLHRLQLSTERR